MLMAVTTARPNEFINNYHGNIGMKVKYNYDENIKLNVCS